MTSSGDNDSGGIIDAMSPSSSSNAFLNIQQQPSPSLSPQSANDVTQNNAVAGGQLSTFVPPSPSSSSLPSSSASATLSSPFPPHRQPQILSQQEEQTMKISASSTSTSLPSSSLFSYTSSSSTSNWNIYELAYWVPLRLTPDERALLTVLEQTLHVSEYTDNVDVTMYGGGYSGMSSSSNSYYRKYNGSLSSNYGNSSMSSSTASIKTSRILDGILEVCHIATGLATASGHERKFVDLCYSYHHYYDRNYSDSDVIPNENGGTSSNGENNGGITNVISSFLNKGNHINNKTLSKQERRERKKQMIEEKKANKIRRRQEKNLNKQQQQSQPQYDTVDDDINQTDTSRTTSITMETSDQHTATTTKQQDESMISKPSLHKTINHNSRHYYSVHLPWANHEPKDNAILFQTMFEIGRRNKVLNPSSMRTTYGKMMYLLQDSQNPTVARTLGFSLHKDLLLIGPYLERNHCIELLHDPRLECAIQYIDDRDIKTGEKLPREMLEGLIDGKNNVMEDLILKYSTNDDNDGHQTGDNGHHSRKMTKTSNLTKDEVRRVIESLADAVVYIESNVRPVQKMLEYLKQNFHPEIEQPRSASSSSSLQYSSLALRGGRSNGGGYGSGHSQYRYGLSAYNHFGANNSEGPTLSHSHPEQYTFVEQSLRLWSKVMRHMHRLWVCADDDLLSTTCTYHLYNTGQGLNRVQTCPKVRKMMTSLLHQTQQESGKSWVGLSVIHLGDRDVPNALIFIDKYTQIPRFLKPIVNLIQSLSSLMDDTRTARYVLDQFGSIQTLKMIILQDYFKHGFDGSGDDGGSCIDGRLTSSWNWTSRLAKKNYYHIFMLSGFQGFDGDFR